MKKFTVSFYEEVHVLRCVCAEVECNDESEIKDKIKNFDYEVLECNTIDERRESELDDAEMQLEIEWEDDKPYSYQKDT
jgi:hypothetical protein